MAWLKNPFAKTPDTPEQAAARERSAAWEAALSHDHLPPFVEARLHEAKAGTTPWTSTMTPAELLLAKHRGVHPIATVSGTCWYQYGRSWTEGHAAGWRSALHRIKAEAKACGANAVVDVKMRTVHGIGDGQSMDFTLVGTAIRLDGVPASSDPIVATAPLLDFMRLMQAGIVPVGIAVGAQYNWLIDYQKVFGGSWTSSNQVLSTLSAFWENLRRDAHAELRADTKRQGNGVLAHTQLGQLMKVEGDPLRYLGRHIVVGTVVQAGEKSAIDFGIQTVVDMRDDLSPLFAPDPHAPGAHDFNEREGGI